MSISAPGGMTVEKAREVVAPWYQVVSKFADTLPDMRFAIHEILVAANRVVVRGEVSATPSGELFGLPHTGRSFRIMAIDIQTLRGRKIDETSRWRTG
jgi:predicted ester cyclase